MFGFVLTNKMAICYNYICRKKSEKYHRTSLRFLALIGRMKDVYKQFHIRKLIVYPINSTAYVALDRLLSFLRKK